MTLTPRTKSSSGAMRLLEFSELITPDGAVFRFNKSTDRFVFAEQGMGLPPITFFTQTGPFQDGATPTGFAYEPRIIQMVYVEANQNSLQYWESRGNLIDFLRQNRQEPNDFSPSVLRRYLPNGSKRDIGVFVEQGPVLSTSDADSWNRFTINDPIRFVAYDPAYYNPVKISLTLNYHPITGLIFPVEEPISFGGAGAQSDFVVYNGTYKTYPELVILGPAQNVSIYNLSTNQKLILSYIIGTGEIVTITTGLSNFTVTSSSGADLRGAVDIVSDPLFALKPSPSVPDGENLLSLAAYGVDSNTEFTINYFERYIGI